MGFREILEIHQLSRDTLGISMYTYPPEKNRSTNSNGLSSRSPFEGIMPLQPAVTTTSFLRCCRSCYLIAWLILKLLLGLAGWPALFEKRVFLTLNRGLQSTCLTDRPLCEMDPIWTAGRLRSRQSIGQFEAKSGKWKLAFFHKNLTLKESTSTPATTQVCNSLGWLFLLFQVALMELHQGLLEVTLWWVCVHWILQQNLRIQSQSPEQKLCHKARRFYVMATSRPFTYLEPSITARSSGASFDLYVQIYVFLYHQVDTLSQMKRETSFLLVSNYVWTDLVPSTHVSISNSQDWDSQIQILQKSVRNGPRGPWPTHLCLYVKTNNACILCMETRKHVPAEMLWLFIYKCKYVCLNLYICKYEYVNICPLYTCINMYRWSCS